MDVFRVALPPTVALDAVPDLAAAFRVVLEDVVRAPVDVTVSQTYDVLARNLLSGAVDLAWAPPFVCARTEPDGARVLVVAIRGGHATYASALVVKKERAGPLSSLRGSHAVFVDPVSVAGHLLPLAHLGERVPDPGRFFARVSFAGSYRAALELVDEGGADVTAVHALPGDPASALRAIDAHLGLGTSNGFATVELTAETPSEGLVLGPRAGVEAEPLVAHLERLHELPRGRHLLEKLFLAERFARATPGTYRVLYRILPRA